MRVVSLLPAATEMVAALGALPRLVGVSHECDYPPEARALPRVTRTRLDTPLPSAEIDRAMAPAHPAGPRPRPHAPECLGSGVARPALRGGPLGARAGRDRRRPRCGRPSRGALHGALLARAVLARAGPRGRRAVWLRRRPRPAGARRCHGPGRAGAARPARRIHGRECVHLAPRPAARGRGRDPGAVDRWLMLLAILLG